MAKANKSFFTKANSPFADGYDIEAEREYLKPLIESDEDQETHPDWFRYMEYLDREETLKKMEAELKQRQFADPIVPFNEAKAMIGIGGLVASETDTMEVHTREAYRVFIGRTREESNGNGGRYGITSGKRVAAILRSIWNLSANDNPYADWMLVQVSEHLDLLRQELKQAIQQYENVFTKDQERGLKVSVLKSRAPVKVELGFRSPYGYMVVDLILDFDYYTRVVKTMVGKNKMTDDEGRSLIRGFNKKIRALFESTLPYQKYLLLPQLKDLSRSDFLPGADEHAHKRVEAAAAIFGQVPAPIFTGEQKPRHSKRRGAVNEQEMRLLLEVAQGRGEDIESVSAGSEEGLV